MAQRVQNPLRKPPAERRGELTGHLIVVIESLLDGSTAYADLSVEQIIRAGGISRATFYAYYKDKGDLLRAIARGVGEEIAASGYAWWRIADDVTEAVLGEALRPAVDAYLRHNVVLRAVAETSSYDSGVRSAYGELMSGTIAQLSEHIVSRQRRGLTPPGLDARRTATWLVWMFERGLYQAVSIDAEHVEEWLASATHVVWSALYATV